MDKQHYRHTVPIKTEGFNQKLTFKFSDLIFWKIIYSPKEDN